MFVLSPSEIYNLNNYWTQMNADFVVSTQSNDYQDFTYINFSAYICENPPTVYIMLIKFNVWVEDFQPLREKDHRTYS